MNQVPRHRRLPGGRTLVHPTPVAVVLVFVLVLVLVLAAFLVAVLPSSPGWSASFDDTLTRDDRSHSHDISVEAGTLHAELTFAPTVETLRPPTASIRLTTADGRTVAFRYGRSPVVLDTVVATGEYRLVVTTAWPLSSRDLDYTLDVAVTPGDGGSTEPTATPTSTTSTTVPPTQSPSTPGSTPTSTDPTKTPTSAPGSPTSEPTSGPVVGSNQEAACGTWVLLQVDSVAALRSQRPRIEDALALPGVTGFSVRFPWDAADLTGSETTNALLDEAYDITRDAGKALSIRFMAGAHTPQRVFDDGAASYTVDGSQVPLPWDTANGKAQVFLDAYAAYAGKLAAWSRSHGVRLLHLSWYGQDWAELNHGAELRDAPGYSEQAWLDGHRDLIDVGVDLSSRDLAVELPLSGYGPLSSGESAALGEHVVDRLGPDNDRFFVQANGWDETQEWGSPTAVVESQFDRIWQQPLVRGLQMIQPDGYEWARVYDRLREVDATYGEVYLPSFWQVPGPSAAYANNTSERIAQLEREIADFAAARCR